MLPAPRLLAREPQTVQSSNGKVQRVVLILKRLYSTLGHVGVSPGIHNTTAISVAVSTSPKNKHPNTEITEAKAPILAEEQKSTHASKSANIQTIRAIR